MSCTDYTQVQYCIAAVYDRLCGCSQGDGTQGLEEQPAGSQQQQQKAKHKQKQRLLEVDRGPVHVKVLTQRPAPKASGELLGL